MILIDECDKPLLSTMGDDELETAHRNALKPLYGVLKTCDKYIKFAFLNALRSRKISSFPSLLRSERAHLFQPSGERIERGECRLFLVGEQLGVEKISGAELSHLILL